MDERTSPQRAVVTFSNVKRELQLSVGKRSLRYEACDSAA